MMPKMMISQRFCNAQKHFQLLSTIRIKLLSIIMLLNTVLIFPQINYVKQDSSGTAIHQTFSSYLDTLIQNIMITHHLPGVSACAVKNGEIIWTGAYGYADISQNIEVTDSTLFMLASVSKTVTGTAFMQLYEDGLITLDDDINNYLPIQINHPSYPQTIITPRMLLSHVSGIKDNWSILGPLEYHGGDSPIPLSDFIQDYLVPGGIYYNIDNFNSSEPGTVFDYTNVGSALIAYLVEVIAGISFEQYCQENIFSLIDMNETSWFLANLNLSNLAIPYVYNNGNYISYGHYGSPVYPCGFLKTSSFQLAQYLVAIMQKGQINNVRILDSATVELTTSLHYPTIAPGYGLFFQIIGELRGHSGGAPGVATRMFYNFSTNVGVIVLLNIENQSAVSLIFDEIFSFAENYVMSVDPASNNLEVPQTFTLYQNYPNPFNPTTNIEFRIAEFGFLSLKVFDVLGNEVAILVNEEKPAGSYEVKFDGNDLSSGIYIYQLRAGDFISTKKMILMK